jgi:hypothetical protein
MELQEALKAIETLPVDEQMELVMDVWTRLSADGVVPDIPERLRLEVELMLAEPPRPAPLNRGADRERPKPMNLNESPTPEQLTELLTSCDDRAGNHLLWVKRNGDVEITLIHHPRFDVARLRNAPAVLRFQRQHPEMQLRCESFLAGNRYVGPEAPAKEDWIVPFFKALVRAWDKAKGKPEVAYLPIPDIDEDQ